MIFIDITNLAEANHCNDQFSKAENIYIRWYL